MALVLTAGLVAQYLVLTAEVDREVEADLLQEAEELRGIADRIDPATAQGAAVAEVFDSFLAQNIPSLGEMMFAMIDGSPYKSTLGPAQLFEQEELVARWAAYTEPTWGEATSPAGPVRYLAVPLRSEDRVVGTFVVAIFMDQRLEGVGDAVRAGAIVFGSAFLIASATAWLGAGRVLRPIRQVTEAARSITDTNWRRRIDVAGDEEVAELARTFNAMLDRLEEAFAAQRRFIDDAGHELRTPITIIRGHLELWGNDPKEAAEAQAVIDDELTRMARIVDELLLLAKAEHPGFLELEPVDIAAFTDEIAAKARVLDAGPWIVAGRAGIVVIADRQRLIQAIMNLAANAVEHTPPGTPIEIGSVATADGVRIWVKDEGPGIDPQDRERIFDRFDRGRSGRRNTRGAGLGLSIVAAIASAHRGQVTVASEPGQGSTFSIVLPLDPDIE